MKNSDAQVFANRGLVAIGLAATPTGTGNDCVAAWVSPDRNRGAGDIASWATRSASADEAADGTSWALIQRGIYLVQASLLVAPSVTVHAGINVAGEPAQLLVNPTMADAFETRDVGIVVNPASTNSPIKLSALVRVTQDQAAAASQIVRILLSNGSNTGPAGAALTLAQCWASIDWLGDLN